jgi:hypothetical protein
VVFALSACSKHSTPPTSPNGGSAPDTSRIVIIFTGRPNAGANDE